MLLPTRKVNARIRKEKKPTFRQIFGRELSEVLFSVAFGLSGLTNFSQLHNLPAFFVIARARPPQSHFTQYIFLLTTFFYAARDIRCVLGILAILKSSQAHTEKKSWENINIVMRAYRLALARSHLISRSPHISILSWACRDDDDFGVCKLFSYIFRALI